MHLEAALVMGIELCAENQQRQVTTEIFFLHVTNICIDLKMCTLYCARYHIDRAFSCFLTESYSTLEMTALLASFCVAMCEIEAYKYCNEESFGLSLNFQQTYVKAHSVG